MGKRKSLPGDPVGGKERKKKVWCTGTGIIQYGSGASVGGFLDEKGKVAGYDRVLYSSTLGMPHRLL